MRTRATGRGGDAQQGDEEPPMSLDSAGSPTAAGESEQEEEDQPFLPASEDLEGEDWEIDDDYEDADEDYSLDEDEDEDDDEDDLAMAFSVLSGHVYSRVVNSMPLLRDHVPEPLDNDLAEELSLRTAPIGLRSTFRATGPMMSPTRCLMLREMHPGGSGAGMHQRAARHAATFHRMPIRPTNIVDRMQSRAYIGRFTADGDIFIAAFQNERKIKLYDVHNDWKLIKNIHARNLRWTVCDVALSSDSRFLLYSSITPVVHLVNVQRGAGGTGATESIANITDVHEALNFNDDTRSNAIWSLRWSPDSREIIGGTGDSSLYIYDLASGRTVVRVQGHSDDVNAVAYADGDVGNLIITGSDDHEIKVWDRRTLGQRRGTPVGVFIGHTEGVAHVDAKGDGRYFISNSKDQSIKLWDIRNGRTNKEANAVRRTQYDKVPSFRWDYRWQHYPAEGRVVQHPADGAVATYRGGHKLLSTLSRAYWSPAETTGQRYIYVASACGAVVIYDVITCQEVARLSYHREIVRDCSWHPHLPLLATAAFDGSIVTWEPEVPGEEEADAEEEEARRVAAGIGEFLDEPPRRRRSSAASAGAGGGVTASGRRKTLPQPGRDQLGDWW